MPNKKKKKTSSKQTSSSTKFTRPALLKGGLADGVPDHVFDTNKLLEGLVVELEHSKTYDKNGNISLQSQNVAKEIAKDHLMEIPDYYSRLKRMEAEARRYWQQQKYLYSNRYY
jgi:hypothetical protein